MPTAHLESAFEAEIVAHLTGHGWNEGAASSYRRNLGLGIDARRCSTPTRSPPGSRPSSPGRRTGR